MNARSGRKNGRYWRHVLVLALLLVLAGVVARACAPSSSSNGGGETTTEEEEAVPQTGVIGGHAFTVLTGTISQAADDEPITSVGGDAFILFDESTDTLVPGTGGFNIVITMTMGDGNRVVVYGLGTAANNYADGVAVGMERNDERSPVFTGSFYAPADETADAEQIMAPVNVETFDPDGTLLFAADLHPYPNTENYDISPGFTLWKLDSTIPLAGCSNNYGYSIEADPVPGTGNRVGILLNGATIQDVDFDDPVFYGC